MKFSFPVILLLIITNAFAQNMSISDVQLTANPLSILDISVSTNDKGVLIPRVTTAQMNAITGVVSTGLLVYNTTENMFYYNNSTTATSNWVPLLSTAISTGTGLAGWGLIGNAGTNPANNFLGTSDAQDFIVRTNSQERIRFATNGNVGIATGAVPAYQLTIAGSNSVLGLENTATLLAKNSTGTYEPFWWPRWSDNAMYMNYGSAGLNIRNNALTSAMFIQPTGEVGIGKTTGILERLDVNGNIKASGIAYWGNAGSRTEIRANAGDGTANTVKSGFYETADPTPFSANWPVGANSWWHLLDVRHVHNNNYALQFSGSFFDQNMYFRKTNSNANQAWTRVLTFNDDMPTYGFIKNTFASPGAGATTFYSDSDINFSISDRNVQFSSVTSSTWDVYAYFEESQGGLTPSTRGTRYTSTGAANWQTIFRFDNDAGTGSGGTIWFSRENNNTSPMYHVIIMRHGSFYTALIRRFDP
jgi:hypothetical protein